MTQLIHTRHGHLAIAVHNEMIVFGKCFVTGDFYSVACRRHQYVQWQEGKHIQDVMPDLSDGDREFLISGTSPVGFDMLFKEEEDDDNHFD